MKKIITCIGFLLAFALSQNEVEAKSITNENGIKMSSKEVGNLKSLGFTTDEIENMDKTEFNANKKLKGEVVATTNQYLKITEYPDNTQNNAKTLAVTEDSDFSKKTKIEKLSKSKFNEEVKKANSNKVKALAQETSSTSYKSMTTSITKLSNKKYRLKNSVTWKRIPMNRSIDISGVGINSNRWDPVPNSQYGKQNYTTWSFCNGTIKNGATYTKNSNKWKKGAGGYALKLNLPNDRFGGGCAADNVKTLSSYMYFSVERSTSSKRLDAYGQYAHQEHGGVIAPSISLSGIAFSVSPTNKYVEHPNTHVLVKK